MKSERNAACPCGSGKKYKVCCAIKRPPTQYVAIVSVVVFVAVALFVLAGVLRDTAPADGGQPGPAPPGKVWSVEHGHWHDAPAAGDGWTVPPQDLIGGGGSAPIRTPAPATAAVPVPEIDQVSEIDPDE